MPSAFDWLDWPGLWLRVKSLIESLSRNIVKKENHAKKPTKGAREHKANIPLLFAPLPTVESLRPSAPIQVTQLFLLPYSRFLNECRTSPQVPSPSWAREGLGPGKKLEALLSWGVRLRTKRARPTTSLIKEVRKEWKKADSGRKKKVGGTGATAHSAVQARKSLRLVYHEGKTPKRERNPRRRRERKASITGPTQSLNGRRAAKSFQISILDEIGQPQSGNEWKGWNVPIDYSDLRFQGKEKNRGKECIFTFKLVKGRFTGGIGS